MGTSRCVNVFLHFLLGYICAAAIGKGDTSGSHCMLADQRGHAWSEVELLSEVEPDQWDNSFFGCVCTAALAPQEVITGWLIQGGHDPSQTVSIC